MMHADRGLDDGAAAVAASGRGEETGPSVHLVLVRKLPGSPLVVPLAGQGALDLQAEQNTVDDETVRMLLDSSLVVDAGEDITQEVVDALRRMGVPPLFRASPWLRRCRALVLEDGSAVVGGVRIGYRTGRGLWVDHADVTGE
ncbi:hypothetical protein ACH49O_41150 [Streptomyces coeruleorubidus]|uniref:hypothetical protein n=1 Tax=Streptomyces coeruleorubidus TaxID=116188 RepID=UPI0033E1B6A0